MNVMVLGGAGDMGFGIVMKLARESPVDIIAIGDVNFDAATRKVKGSGLEGRVDVVKVNVFDEGIVDVVKRFDVVVSAIGPCYEYGSLVLSRAIKAGVDFIDICDDHDGVEGSLKLDSEARKAGVTAITGLGWTPGLSNILAVKGCMEGGCKEVNIHWAGSAADSRGFAVIMHVFHALTGDVPQFIDGIMAKVRAGTGREEILYPPPLGKAFSYYTGHPEPVTLPRYLEGVRTVTLRGGLIPDWQNKLVTIFAKLGLTKTKTRKRRLAKLIYGIEEMFRMGGVEASGLRVDVRDRGYTRSFGVVDRMANLTSLPAALGALLLKSEDYKPGVYPPEAAIDHRKFINMLKERGMKFYELEEDKWREV